MSNQKPYDVHADNGKFKKKHGGTGTKLFKVWVAMRQRCNNPKCTEYKNYGARGISICKEWDEFQQFRDWAITHGYDETLSIDRINNDGGYSPDNCRWATASMQASNKRSGRSKTGALGVHQRENGRYRAQVRRNDKVYSVGTFATLEEAVKARERFISLHFDY